MYHGTLENLNWQRTTNMGQENLTLTRKLDLTTAPTKNLSDVMILIKNSVPDDPVINGIDEQLAAKKQQKTKLLGCERATADLLQRQIKELIALREETASLQLFRAEGYIPVSFDVLKWRNQEGWPALVLFDINQPHVKFKGHGRSHPDYPKKIADCYLDIMNKLGDLVYATEYAYCHPKIEAEFSGLIPDAAREKIKEAVGKFEKVYLLAETNFRMGVDIVPINHDPIVLGWDGYHLWYVYDFDLTPVEEAALLQPCH